MTPTQQQQQQLLLLLQRQHHHHLQFHRDLIRLPKPQQYSSFVFRKSNAFYRTPLQQHGSTLFAFSGVLQENATAPVIAATSESDNNNNNKSSTSEDQQSILAPLRSLYPPINSSTNGTLQVDSTHTLYYEQYGRDLHSSSKNKNGTKEEQPPIKVALFLHGGPGAGCFPNHARFFSPDHYCIILFDQRGCGKSTPKGETNINNTLTHLVEDCERLRTRLLVQKWDVILGGSWGTTLALAYAQTYPHSIGSMVLRGVCTFRSREIDWLFSSSNNTAATKLNPMGWKQFEEGVGIIRSNHSNDSDDSSHRNNMQVNTTNPREALHRYYDCLLGSDPVLRTHAMKYWMSWEMSIFGYHRNNNNKQSNLEDLEKQRLLDKSNATMLVWDNHLKIWSLHDDFGPIKELITDQSTLTASMVAESLRQFGEIEEHEAITTTTTDVEPRPINHDTKQFIEASLPPNMTVDQLESFIPAQAMLTCYYSTNRQYVLQPHYPNLLGSLNDACRNIPCIAIQGGQDTICPADTALDLLQIWPEIELRIPLQSGHSMYDERIASEIVKATDRLAGLL